MSFPTTSVLDTFTRADGPLGSNWTSPKVFPGALAIASDACIATDTSDGVWNPTTFGPDCESFATVVTWGADLTGFFLYGRISGNNGYDCNFSRNGTGSRLRIERIDNGVQTQLGAFVSSGAVVTGEQLGMSVVGSTISFYRGTVGSPGFVDSRTDSTYAASGEIGLFIDLSPANGGGTLDDFGGGTVAAAPVGIAGTFPTHHGGRGAGW